MQEFDSDIFESTWFNLFYIMTTLPQIFLTLYIIILKPGRKLSDYNINRFKPADLLKAAAVLLGIYICIIPVGFISKIFVPDLGNPVVYGAGWQFGNPSLIPLVVISCIATGYSEEIFFRAYLVKSLEKSGLKIVPAAAVSALLFGSGHIYEGFYAFAATAVIAVFLSFVFTKTKSIHAISIGHGLYNFSVLIISMMGVL
ncbi:MAG: CPBP family intramembrane metalloprotease [Spirochaetales bacterium]|nr:CPBP family intramembrane metalloprotease [Spirochaetales bacterium]